MTSPVQVGPHPIAVLHRDDHLLALAKPSGLPVHRGWAGAGATLADQARDLAGGARVHAGHRLDRPTSGVVLFALDPETARALAGAFARGEVEKRYLALVRGRPPDSGKIDHPLPRRQGGPRQPARTTFRRLFTAEVEPRHVSLVEAWPQTGRLHQVRRHLKHIDHPVIGDANYGKGALNRAFRDRCGLVRLALHALSLELVHPRTGERLRLVAPIPPDLAAPLERLGIPLLE